MKLSNRLMEAASLVTEGSRFADIGTDHAYVPLYLLEKKIISSAIALDIGKGPLAIAKEHIAAMGYADQIETRLSDGAEKLQVGEVDSILICGMGGGIIRHIFEERLDVFRAVSEVILGPQSEIKELREYLSKEGFQIQEERFLKDAGKYYVFLKVSDAKGKEIEQLSKEETLYGPCLLASKNDTLMVYLKERKNHFETLKESLQKQESERSRERLAVIEEELSLVEKAINRMEA